MLEDKSVGLTPLTQLGEFGLIDRLTRNFNPLSPGLKVGPGDDCAVWEKNDKEFYLASTDILAEGIHFDLSYCPLKHLGYKAIAVNISDICAMNGEPWGILVSIGFSNRFSVEALDELYSGIHAACSKYNVLLLGGDTSTSVQGLFISVTILGSVTKEKLTLRSGAQKNDLICVSGDLGAAYAGLKILQREKSVFLDNPSVQPDLVGFEYVVERQLKPEPRVDMIEALSKANIIPSSMIDISDGLSGDLTHICQASNCGALIYQDKLPVDHETEKVAEQFTHTGHTYALNGGEDYELLFCVSLNSFEKVKDIPGVKIIGHMQDASSGIQLESSLGERIDLKPNSWNHFVA
jgi:thiamine-monophosphate kinase